MKVTFEIEVDDALVQPLDYYANFGELGSASAGCKKCVFRPMCVAFTDSVSLELPLHGINCKFPCWQNKADRLHGTGRQVFVLNSNTNRRAEDE